MAAPPSVVWLQAVEFWNDFSLVNAYKLIMSLVWLISDGLVQAYTAVANLPSFRDDPTAFIRLLWRAYSMCVEFIMPDVLMPFYQTLFYIMMIITFTSYPRIFFERIILSRCLNAENYVWARRMLDEVSGAFEMAMVSFGALMIYENYGWFAFFLVTGVYITFWCCTHQESTVNPLNLFTEVALENQNSCIAVALFVVTCLIAAIPASYIFAIAKPFHRELAFPACQLCALTNPLWWHYLFEFASGFLFRLIMIFLDHPEQKGWRWAGVPWVYAVFLTVGQKFLGMSGLHPAITIGRLLPCWPILWVELGLLLYGVGYLVAVLAGWGLASFILNRIEKKMREKKDVREFYWDRMGSYWQQEKWVEEDAEQLEQVAAANKRKPWRHHG